MCLLILTIALNSLGTFDTLTKDSGIISPPCLHTYIVKITDVVAKKKMKMDSGGAKLQPCNLKWTLPKIGTSLMC